MTHSWIERCRVHQAAKAKLGLRQSPQERFDFMDQCIDALTSDGTAGDDEEAEQICQLLWEEQYGDDAANIGDF